MLPITANHFCQNPTSNRLTFIYILDSILKNVQGHYIRLFEQRIGEIFQVAFENTSRESEKKALIKLI